MSNSQKKLRKNNAGTFAFPNTKPLRKRGDESTVVLMQGSVCGVTEQHAEWRNRCVCDPTLKDKKKRSRRKQVIS